MNILVYAVHNTESNELHVSQDATDNMMATFIHPQQLPSQLFCHPRPDDRNIEALLMVLHGVW